MKNFTHAAKLNHSFHSEQLRVLGDPIHFGATLLRTTSQSNFALKFLIFSHDTIWVIGDPDSRSFTVLVFWLSKTPFFLFRLVKSFAATIF